jgi:adenylate kinase family enzyme
VCGSGKTTLATRISERTRLPWHSIDDLTWEPGWVDVPENEQRRRVEAICAGDEWIIDSAYSQWIDVPLARVDLIVGLDYPRWLSLWRLLKRSVIRAVDRRPVCNGNKESFRQLLSSDSLMVWHFRSFRHKRDRLRQWAADESGPAVVLLRSPRATRRWLSTLAAGSVGVGEQRAPGVVQLFEAPGTQGRLGRGGRVPAGVGGETSSGEADDTPGKSGRSG